jgi:hypothetical protein
MNWLQQVTGSFKDEPAFIEFNWPRWMRELLP